jgi:Ice-binding-like
MIKAMSIAVIAFLAIGSSAIATAATSPAPVNLRSAGEFVILSKAGITDVPASRIIGDIGTSPITGAADLVTCTEVTGIVYSVNAAGPDPCSIKNPTILTTAILDMETAYTDAAGRKNPDFTNLRNGDIGGMRLVPGLYKFDGSVSLPTSILLVGSENDVWIFQIAGNLVLSNAVAIDLEGGVKVHNIFWQVAGVVTVGTTAHLQGIVLARTVIALKTKASVNGRLYSQTAVTLEKNAIQQPRIN